jgi:hypothetical protein
LPAALVRGDVAFCEHVLFEGLEIVLAGLDLGAEAGGPGGVAIAEPRRAGSSLPSAHGRAPDGSDGGAVVSSAILVGSILDEFNRLSRRDNPVLAATITPPRTVESGEPEPSQA